MKNLGLAGAIALCGIGLILIGLGNFRTQTVYAAPAVAAATAVQGKGEPTIVWYDSQMLGFPDTILEPYQYPVLFRAWSDGTIEARFLAVGLYAVADCYGVTTAGNCDPPSSWIVVSSPTDGLSAAADITFDEVVDAQDLAELLARWGDAPRTPMPARDCPLGLLN